MLPLTLALLTGSAALGKPGGDNGDDNGRGGGKKPPQTIVVTPSAELRFGSLVLTSSSGEVTVPVSGLPTYRNAVRVGGITGPARIELRGEPNKTVEVILLSPTTGRFGTLGKGELERLVLIPESGLSSKKSPATLQIKLDRSGFNSITIGGSLTLSGSDSSGPLSVPIPISAVYANG